MKPATSINADNFVEKNKLPYNVMFWLGKNYLQIAITNSKNDKIEGVKTYKKDNGNITANEVLEVLRQDLIKKASNKYIGLESRKYTLIPSSLFNSENKEITLSQVHPILNNELVSNQEIKSLEVQSLFTIKKGTESLFKNELNQDNIYHAPSALLNTYQTFLKNNKISCFVRLQSDEILLTLFNSHNLQLHTSFDIENVDDAAYSLLNTLKELGIEQKNVLLYIHGAHPKLNKFKSIAESNIASCEYINRPENLEYHSSISSEPAHQYFNLYSLLQCV